MWVGLIPISWRALRGELEEEILPQDSSISSCTRVASLVACPINLGLASPDHHIGQFLEIPPPPCVYIYIYIFEVGRLISGQWKRWLLSPVVTLRGNTRPSELPLRWSEDQSWVATELDSFKSGGLEAHYWSIALYGERKTGNVLWLLLITSIISGTRGHRDSVTVPSHRPVSGSIRIYTVASPVIPEPKCFPKALTASSSLLQSQEGGPPLGIIARVRENVLNFLAWELMKHFLKY